MAEKYTGLESQITDTIHKIRNKSKKPRCRCHVQVNSKQL